MGICSVAFSFRYRDHYKSDLLQFACLCFERGRVKSTVAKSAAKNLRGRCRNYRLHSFLLCYIGAKDADHRAVFCRIYMKTDDRT
jgi:hypothetical protein